jgi:type I restriction enzyme S subunit
MSKPSSEYLCFGSLSDLCDVKSGFAFKTVDFENHSSNSVPIVRMSNLKDGQCQLKDAICISKSKLENLQDYFLKNQDFVFGMSGSLSNYAIIRQHNLPCVLNQRVGKLVPRNSVREFLPYIFLSESVQRQILATAAGGAQLNISTKQLLDLEVPVFQYKEQQKIAEILTSVDEVIENTQSQIDKLEDLKNATMNELLTKGIGHTEFKETEIGRIPKSWECKTVRSLLSESILLRVQDGNHGSEYPRTSEFVKHGIPFLSASSIDEYGRFSLEKLPCLTPERASSLRIPSAKGGDVILTHNATVGRVSIIPLSVEEVVVSTSTTYYRTNEKILSRIFLRSYLEGDLFQSQLRRIMGQTTRNQVPITAQRELFVCVPGSLAEQAKISKVVETLSDQVLNKISFLERIHLVKSSLMQDLLTGKVRVTVN